MSHLTKTKLVVYLMAIFLAGAVGGTFLGLRLGKQTSFRPPKDMGAHFRESLQTRLNLSPGQMQQIAPLLEKRSEAMKAIHRSSIKRIEEARTASNLEITPFLTPEQRVKLEAMEQERRDFFQKNVRDRGK